MYFAQKNASYNLGEEFTGKKRGFILHTQKQYDLMVTIRKRGGMYSIDSTTAVSYSLRCRGQF